MADRAKKKKHSRRRDDRGELVDLTEVVPDIGISHPPPQMRSYVEMIGGDPSRVCSAKVVGRFYTLRGYVDYVECSSRTDSYLWSLLPSDTDLSVGWIMRRHVHYSAIMQIVSAVMVTGLLATLVASIVAIARGGDAFSIGATVVVGLFVSLFLSVCQFCRIAFVGDTDSTKPEKKKTVLMESQWYGIPESDWSAALSLSEWMWVSGDGPDAVVAELDNSLAGLEL